MSTTAQGRPPVTTHAAIERGAFELFEARGFDGTTMDDIAAALGIGRRTLFRYYASKNDILWGQFDDSLREFMQMFEHMPSDIPIATAIEVAIIQFNHYDAYALDQHRRRMKLLLGNPTLLAHSEIRYQAWRSVIAEYVAKRIGQQPTDITPTIAARAALAIALTAYEHWLIDETSDLLLLIHEAARSLRAVLSEL